MSFSTARPHLAFLGLALVGLGAACVPSGSAPAHDAGPAPQASVPTFRPSVNVMTAAFEDNFDRPDGGEAAFPAFPLPGGDASADAATGTVKVSDAASEASAADGATAADGSLLARFLEADGGADAQAKVPNNLGPNWSSTSRTPSWRIEKGQLCGEGAKNHGVWLTRVMPVNARIEFDATAFSDDGDLKTEVWGDGHSYATGTSYTNATSYIAVLGGWKNTIHALARLNEHGTDRKEIHVDKDSDDPRQRAVVKGQVYRFKIERTDGKTIHWSVDGVEYLTFADASPLAGLGHDHFGFNEWEAKVCFDNVKVTPL